MTEFLTQLLSLPALPWTVAMGVTVLYWLLVIFGAVGLDMLGGGAESVAGGVKGAGEALSGSLKGVGEALEGGVKSAGEAMGGALKGVGEALEGGVKSAGEAVGEAMGGALKGAGDAAADAMSDAAGGIKGAADAAKHASEAAQGGVFHALGLGKVPVTISFSFISFFGWLASMLLSNYTAGAGLAVRLAATVLSFVAAVLCAAVVVRPLGKVFESPPAARRTDVIGKLAVVTSGRVDAKFGTGLVEDGGAGLNLHLVCGKQNTIKKGDRVLVLDYDAKADAYDVEPLDWLEPVEQEALKDPQRAAQVLASRVRLK